MQYNVFVKVNEVVYLDIVLRLLGRLSVGTRVTSA